MSSGENENQQINEESDSESIKSANFGLPKKYDYADLFEEMDDKLEEAADKYRFHEKLRYPDKMYGNRIKSWIGSLKKRKIDSLDGIKQFLNRIPRIEKSKIKSEANILKTILNCKQEGSRIYFNTYLFKNPLRYYLFGEGIKVKCLTDDYLNLIMNSQILLKDKLGEFDILKYATLTEAKVVSDNFRYADKELITRGYVQDYDARFSSLAAPGYPKEAIEKFLQSKPKTSSFKYDGYDFIYYGNEEIYFVTPSNMQLTDALKKYNDIKFLKTEDGSLKINAETIPYNPDLHYIEKTLKPEKFCPAFWATSAGIEVSFLFTFSFDYNELYDYLIKTIKNEQLQFPPNLCYWDNANQFFDFISVIALTTPDLPQKTQETLADWTEEYYALKPAIRKIGQNYYLMGRIFQEFLNCFLYDADYPRFQRLRARCRKCIGRYNAFVNSGAISAVGRFFNKIPCAQMIVKQLANATTDVLKSVIQVLNVFLDGKNPRGVEDSIKSTARKIHDIMPHDGDMANATFPFICAPGPLIGKELRRDVVKYKVEKRILEREKEEKKSQIKEDQESEIASKIDTETEDYIRAWLELHLGDKKLRASYDEQFEINEIFNLIRNNNLRTQFNALVKKFKKGKTGKLTKAHRNQFLDGKFLQNLLDTYVVSSGSLEEDDDEKSEEKKPTKKLKKKKVEVVEESDSEEEEEEPKKKKSVKFNIPYKKFTSKKLKRSSSGEVSKRKRKGYKYAL